jgi:adenine-specific DNA-methyltransferase
VANSKRQAVSGRLSRVLRELFGLDEPELDFGIHRLFRTQLAEVHAFVDERLVESARHGAESGIDVDLACRCLHDFWRGYLDGKFAGAPADGYFVKAAEYLTHYAFRLPSDRRVRFERVSPIEVDHEPPDTRSRARRYVLCPQVPAVVVGRELCLRFVLRWELKTVSQAKLNQQTLETLGSLKKVAAWQDELGAASSTRKSKRPSTTQMQKHLARFTTEQPRDYRIHKDLRNHLRQELDQYLQEQLWSLDEIQKATVDGLASRAQTVKWARDVGHRIVDWLANREELQKRIYLACRMVKSTDYCVTLDQVPQELYEEISANKAQCAEWQRLIGINVSQSVEALRDQPYLMLDTRNFKGDFRDRLLASLEPLDAKLDGVLVHGDNLQALRLLQRRYAQQVKCIFLDPPYNTGSDALTYRDQHSHDDWVAFVRDRLIAGRRLLRDDGAIFITLDDHEQARLKLLLDEVLGPENFLATIVWEKVHTRKNSARHFSVSHDYIPAYARDKALWERQLLPRDDTSAYNNPDSDPRGPWKPDPIYANKPYASNYQIHKPNGAVLDPPAGRYWRFSEANFLAKVERGEVLWGREDSYPLVKRYLADVQAGLVPTTWFTREFAGDNALANAELHGLFGGGRAVSYPKPTRLIVRLAQIATRPTENDIVLDFFAGSGTTGHAVIDLNRQDAGNRKYLLVEREAYFDTILVPRIKKAVYASQWRAGQAVAPRGVSQRFKVLRLESHEEALHRWLDIETNPLARRDEVDLVETFNCLLGLTVERYYRTAGFRWIEGTDPEGKSVVILWKTGEAIDSQNPTAWPDDARDKNVDICYYEDRKPPRRFWRFGKEPQFIPIRDAFSERMFAIDP